MSGASAHATSREYEVVEQSCVWDDSIWCRGLKGVASFTDVLTHQGAEAIHPYLVKLANERSMSSLGQQAIDRRSMCQREALPSPR